MFKPNIIGHHLLFFHSISQVTSQRQQYQEYTKGRPTPLTKQRKELLDEIGFQFRIRNRPEWSSKYEELLAYKKKHGDTRVPQHFRENKALGKVRKNLAVVLRASSSDLHYSLRT